MKKFTTFLFALIGTTALLSLSSCKKIWDEIKKYPDGAADNCRVTLIASKEYWDEVIHDTARFVYNSYGDPVRINRSVSRLDAYTSDRAFVYDNQHRLVAFIDDIQSNSGQSHDLNVGLFWHTYTYTGASKIIDSLFVYPSGDYTASFRPTSYDHVEVSTLTLDNWGRVVKETYPGGNEHVYNYDTNGNLIGSGVSYTNKTNILQTHKTWMLINRNYSINQPEGQVKQYNGNKLPYTFIEYSQIYFAGFYFTSGTITYSCK